MHDKLTWLHLSDIHFCPKMEWRDSESRSDLLTYLGIIFSEDDSLRPDLVFCTGDIAFGEVEAAPIADQYAKAKQFFTDLLAICGQKGQPLPRERLFIVPGNHDVNRRLVNTDAQTTLTNWARNANKHVELINQRFNDLTKEFRDTITRLDDYSQFVKDFLPHQFDDAGRHHYASVISLQGLRVGVAGFNSAWTCSGPEDDRNIWLAAKWQFNAAHRAFQDVDIRIGLIHHPIDWLNTADREVASQRIGTNFDFWLHGHTHSAAVTPIQSHTVIAAGAIGAENTEEFGINITSLDFKSARGTVHLHSRKSESQGWTISPVDKHAPAGKWPFDLPSDLRQLKQVDASPSMGQLKNANVVQRTGQVNNDFVDRYLTKKLDSALRSFSTQPDVWVPPTLSGRPEIALDAKSEPKVDLENFIANVKSTIIKAPPQFGLTCLSHFLAREAWRSAKRSLWLYLDAKNIKPFKASIEKAINDELDVLGHPLNEIKCVILDSWSANEKDAFKLLNSVCDYFSGIPIICMQQIDGNQFNFPENIQFNRTFDVLHLWSLARNEIRQIVSAYNRIRHVGDEDAVTSRIAVDLQVLNLHRTPLNCLTLLKVSEFDFDESPVNRSEVIKRVLFVLFNSDSIPTYKARPDLKDCEYVLGYFCELLLREGSYFFTRDRFLLETQKCCKESLFDLETQVLFDVLYANNILIKSGSFFCFKFSYWIFYFAAQRMHHDSSFAQFVFDQMRYVQYPEIIEFYTGIDRRREDALEVVIRDMRNCREQVQRKCGLPDNLNPYRFGKWTPSSEMHAEMQQEIADGVRESQLPAVIKDQYVDRHYDRTRPYNQSIGALLSEYSFANMMMAIRAGARALRNSDYAKPTVKRRLLSEILCCWEEASKVLLVILPILAERKYATFDGAGFVLTDEFSNSPEERIFELLTELPRNVASWFEDDLFSQKMGPLLFDQLGTNEEIGAISRHELILLLIHRRPRDWEKYVQRYIGACAKNSFFLFDVYRNLRTQYRYGFASPQNLRDIEHLIKMAGAKHITGDKEPSNKTIRKVKFAPDVIPPREV